MKSNQYVGFGTNYSNFAIDSRTGNISFQSTSGEIGLNTKLAIMRTALANQRTYLAYTWTGFAIVTLAVKYESNVIISIGMILIAVGIYQYYTIAIQLKNNKTSLPNKEIPLIFAFTGIIAIYYYFSKIK